MNNHVWFAAWIAPVFLIRYTRTNTWANAVILGSLAITTAYVGGLVPTLAAMAAGGGFGDMDALHVLRIFILPLSAVPLFVLISQSYDTTTAVDDDAHADYPGWAVCGRIGRASQSPTCSVTNIEVGTA